VSAYKATESDTARACHLARVVGNFTVVISAGNAELLAGILGSEKEATDTAA
jgi:hypothetical protein